MVDPRLLLEGVLIGAADVGAVSRDYALLLGVEPAAAKDGGRRFQLERGSVEIGGGTPGLQALRLVGNGDEAGPWHGVPVAIGAATAVEPPAPRAADAVAAIDHVVVRSSQPERAIALWRDRVGMRLALDREFPERGLRLLFFRSGGMTLEYATPLAPPDEPASADALWGVSYRVPDLAARRARLLAAGIDVSEIRPGMRPGTVVMTVRSATGGVPTLMLEVTELRPSPPVD